MQEMFYRTAAPENFGGLPAEFSQYDRATAVILPIPLERTTTYMNGTRNGPAAILAASRNMELYDEELELEPYRFGGIATLPAMETQEGSLETVLREIEAAGRRLWADGKFPVALGGEHSLTPPLVAAACERYRALSVLQIDAHADLRDSYQDNPYSHACAMRRVVEKCPAVQVGIRSLSAEEAEVLPRLNTRIYWAKDIVDSPLEVWAQSVVADLSEHVYVTIDLDGFDPAVVPATGTPEPGGLSWYQVTGLLRLVARRRNIVGFDVVELLPQPGHHASDFLAARLVYKLLGYVFHARNS
jgi:agmatinase